MPKLEGKIPIVDFDNFKQVSVVNAPAGMQFYGHGAFHPLGSSLFLSLSNANGDGKIAAISPDDLRIKYVFESFGYSPHDLHFLNDGTLVVANSGWSHKAYAKELPSSICFIEVNKSGVKLKKKVLTNHRGVTAHHLVVDKSSLSRDPDIFVGLATPFSKVEVPNQKSLVAVVRKNDFQLFSNDSIGIDVLNYNVLSLAGASSLGAIVTTTPETVAAIWDTRSKRFSSIIEEIKHPKGVNIAMSFDDPLRGKFYITTAGSGIFELVIKKEDRDSVKIESLSGMPGSKFLQNVSGHSLLVD